MSFYRTVILVDRALAILAVDTADVLILFHMMYKVENHRHCLPYIVRFCCASWTEMPLSFRPESL